MYSLLSLALQYPDEEVTDLLFGGWAQGVLTSSLDELRGFGYESIEELEQLSETLSREWDASDLRKEYTRLFISSHLKLPCPPYESVYVSKERGVLSDDILEVLAIMRSWGLGISEDFKDLPEHVAVELELAAYLLEQMKLGIQESDPEYAERAERDLRKLIAHLRRWVPRFSQCVNAETRVEFYRDIVAALDAYIEDEANLLNLE